MSETPSITAISVNFNAGQRIVECIESLINLPEITRIIVSDNNSQRGDKELLEKLKAQHQKLIVLLSNENYGFSKGNNLALDYATTPYVLFLNPDSRATPSAITSTLNFMELNPDIGMCGPLVLNEDSSEQRGCRRDEPTPWKALKTLIISILGCGRIGFPLASLLLKHNFHVKGSTTNASKINKLEQAGMQGAYNFARIRSYISTCIKHGVSATEALNLAIQGDLPTFMTEV